MDGGVPIPTWTKRATTQIQTVVVFGDSLCDIGKKWKTNSGQLAIKSGDMYVSPTGRFSDCRNWTDFMFEEASGVSMVQGTPEATMKTSEQFTSLKPDNFLLNGPNSFQYANYAEGGACGDKPPAPWPAVLGYFSQQVDAFLGDCKTLRTPLNNTLFIIWFGANDLYTAGRKAVEMSVVAKQVADAQRQRLADFHKHWNMQMCGAAGTCKFIFVDLCRPLTAVRYQKRLQDAEAKMRARLGWQYVGPQGAPPPKGTYEARTFQARHTLNLATSLGHLPGKSWRGVPNEVEVLRAQVEEIKELEKGAHIYNACLKSCAHGNGDRVAEVGNCITEETLLRLVRANFRLKAGAMPAATTSHISAFTYDTHNAAVQHTTTIDEVHPTDQMYKLIWLEIREQIRGSKCTFGNLGPAYADSPMATMQNQENYGAVMGELLRSVPRKG